MDHTSRNFHAHGGSEWVIGGKLTFLPGATVEALPALLSETERLLAALREAGMMVPASEGADG